MITIFSNEILPDEITICKIFEIVTSLIKNGSLKNYSIYENLPKYKKNLLSALQSKEKLLFVAIDNSNAVCGFLTTSFNSPKTISLICVSPDHHRQGIGKELIYALQEGEKTLSACVDSLSPDGITNLLKSCYFKKGKESVWDWEINLEKQKELAERMTALLKLFSDKSKDLKISEYFEKCKAIEDELKQYSHKRELLKTNPAYNHENCHKSIWDKYKIKSEFRVNQLSPYQVCTVPLDFYEKIVENGWDKEKVINIMKEVSLAAFNGENQDECRSDIQIHAILSRY